MSPPIAYLKDFKGDDDPRLVKIIEDGGFERRDLIIMNNPKDTNITGIFDSRMKGRWPAKSEE